jgi:2,3-bisphosphoglycerate-independent phosphoglycerate mutase
MEITEVWEELALDHGGSIVYVIMDGVGGIPDASKGGTELEVARTPNLDRLAGESACGLLEMVGGGITPGSGPGHLALFGYDPLRWEIGRGVLSALGIDFELEVGDVAARMNFATVDAEGNVTDRRAGRISTEENERLCEKLRDCIDLDFDGEFFLETVSEHRAVLVFRAPGLESGIGDTDPQATGVPPLEPLALDAGSENTARLVNSFVDKAARVLADEDNANMPLLRGFQKYEPIPSLADRFRLRGLCIAQYPMYRGISRLLGMDVLPPPEGIEGSFEALKASYHSKRDFYFLHLKKTDSYGEDGDFAGKVGVIEETDRMLPLALGLEPDVLVVTGDHSTPSQMKGHSWHPVPVMLRARTARVDRVDRFDELSCGGGSLGLRPGVHIMGLSLANAGRLEKYGA